jgi:antibiotic biosynthesis monooxygenase (ABM) superfamily enzyme
MSGELMRGQAESNALLTSVRNCEEGIYAKNHNYYSHDVEGEAIGSVTRQPVVKPKRWKLFLLTVAALYPLTLLIPEVLRSTSHLIPALTEGVVRSILAAALLVASVMFVIIPFCNRVFKKWLNS